MAAPQICINYIRAFCADVVQKANSGHPGAPMGMAPMAHVLFNKFLNFSPANPKWLNRDRFVLSNGHACALLYTMLHLNGYENYSLEDLKQFRQLNSKTPGHPEAHFDGVETSTGPLGQGLSNAVGLAIAQENLAATFNREGFEIFNNNTFVFCGDGCLMEGITAEAASYAGHLGLGRLVVLYDDNKISIDGSTDITFTEDVLARFEAYGWHTLRVNDGDSDVDSIASAIETALSVRNKPSLIAVRTIIGYGSKNQNTEKVHGAPLGEDDIAKIKQQFGLDPAQKFFVPEDVRSVYLERKQAGEQKEATWNALYAQYKDKYPELASEIERRFENRLPEGWKDKLPVYKGDKAKATRTTSWEVLQALNSVMPELIGGSADLAGSNKSILNGTPDFQKDSYHGRNLRFGVREHAMAAIVNGIAAYGGLLPYGATFLNFIGYCLGSVTVSALSHHRAFFVMTHDSIGLGEDGPTHQPVEKLLLCRSTPNLLLLRPADGNETAGAYAVAIQQKTRPTVLALSRQDLPQIPSSSVDLVARGAYVLLDTFESSADASASSSSSVVASKPDIIIVSTGSEVEICLKALSESTLKGKAVRLVSMPSWELFDEQDSEYRLSIFPDGVPVLSVEAGVTMGWSRYAHASIGVDTFGMSAPANQIYEHFGITPSNIAATSVKVIDYYQAQPPVSRLRNALFN